MGHGIVDQQLIKCIREVKSPHRPRFAEQHKIASLSRPAVRQREEHLIRFLEEEIWPLIPPEQLGRPLSKAEREHILGFGEDGV